MFNYTLFYKKIDRFAIRRLSCGRCGKRRKVKNSLITVNNILIYCD